MRELQNNIYNEEYDFSDGETHKISDMHLNKIIT